LQYFVAESRFAPLVSFFSIPLCVDPVIFSSGTGRAL
jgi:hypothetical protein